MKLDELINLKLRDNDNEFTHCGTITVDQHQFTPEISQDIDEAGVYLWVSRDKNDSYKPLYVGKAKNGPRSRLSQHKSGINKNTVTAEARRTQILKETEGGSLEVFFRASPTMNFLGVNNVSTYSLDEEAFILRFSPPLNRSTPPVVVVPNKESLIEAMTDRFDHYYDESQWNAWVHYLNSLSPGRKELVERALRKTQELAGGGLWALDIGVTGSYNLGPPCRGMSGRPVLVFGKYVNVKFAANGKFALLALDEGSDAEQQPDILFFRNDDRVADCYSYERFVQDGVGLSDAAREKLDAITEVIN